MADDPSSSIGQGIGLRLRAVEPGDWAAFHAWDADTEAARAAYSVPFPRSVDAARRWAERAAIAEPDCDVFRWVIEDTNGVAVGTIDSHSCDRRAGTFGYAVFIAAPFRSRGHAGAAILLVLRYFFSVRAGAAAAQRVAG